MREKLAAPGQGLAVVLALTPVVLHQLAPSPLDGRWPYILFVPIMAIASVWGGAACALTYMLVSLWMVGTQPALLVSGESSPNVAFGHWVGGVSMLMVGLVIIGVTQFLRHCIRTAKAAEDRYRALVEASATIVFNLDARGLFPGPNRSWTAYTGRSWLDQREAGFGAVLHPDDMAAVLSLWTSAQRQSSDLAFQARTWHAESGRYRHTLWRAVPILDPHGAVQEWIGAMADIEEQKTAGDVQSTLVRELQHRVKNVLAVVMGLARQTARTSPDLTEFMDRFVGRIEALSGAHILLSDNRWTDADLAAVAEAALKPFWGRAEAFEISGPMVRAPPSTATSLVLVLHELATNAFKHGALACPRGRVVLSWTLAGERVKLTWRETGREGGPEAAEQGFGLQLLNDALQFEREGAAAWTLTEDGLVCELSWRAEGWREATPA